MHAHNSATAFAGRSLQCRTVDRGRWVTFTAGTEQRAWSSFTRTVLAHRRLIALIWLAALIAGGAAASALNGRCARTCGPDPPQPASSPAGSRPHARPARAVSYGTVPSPSLASADGRTTFGRAIAWPAGLQQGQLAPGRDQQAESLQLRPHRLARTRVSSLWVAVALFAIILLLLVFVLQNGKSVSVSFFGASGHLPLGVALLLAAVLGVLLVVVPGTARIVQLRVTARRHRKIDMAVESASLPE